jgi:hypothetical protein
MLHFIVTVGFKVHLYKQAAKVPKLFQCWKIIGLA